MNTNKTRKLASYRMCAAAVLLSITCFLSVSNGELPDSSRTYSELTKKEYEVYAALIQLMEPVDEFEAYLKSCNPDHYMPKMNLLVYNDIPEERNNLTAAKIAEGIPDSVSEETRLELASDYLRKSRGRAELSGGFSDNPLVSLVSRKEIDPFFAHPDTGGWVDGWEKLRAAHGPSALISFSRVGFSRDSTYALVYYDYTTGGLSGAGYLVLLEKRNGEWVILASRMQWIS